MSFPFARNDNFAVYITETAPTPVYAARTLEDAKDYAERTFNFYVIREVNKDTGIAMKIVARKVANSYK